MTTASDIRAPQRGAVAFCCDAGYLPFAASAAWQMLTRCDGAFDVLICSVTPLELPPALQHPRLRMVCIDPAGQFDGLHRDGRRNDLTYLRLLLPDHFAGEYDRILYMDSDVFISGGDVGALLSVDLGTHPVGAVRDTRQWRTPGRKVSDMTSLGVECGRYFNAGVMLIDVAAFRAAHLTERLLSFGRTHGPDLYYADQTLLNCVLRDDWAELSPVWNWQYSWSARIFEPMVGANVLHFIGPDKPWRNRRGHVPPRIVAHYMAFLARHFPDQAPPDMSVAPLDDLVYVRKMMFRSLLSAHRMRRYLRRFPDDLAVH